MLHRPFCGVTLMLKQTVTRHLQGSVIRSISSLMPNLSELKQAARKRQRKDNGHFDPESHSNVIDIGVEAKLHGRLIHYLKLVVTGRNGGRMNI